MTRPIPRTRIAVAAVAASALAVAALPATAAAPTGTGPNTTTSPYVVPTASGVDIASLLTVDDDGSADNGYEMAGTPDGLGAIGKGKQLITFMNHEFSADKGIERAHGEKGSFISRYVIDSRTGRVKKGADLVQPGVQYWDYLTSSYAEAPNGPGTQSDGDAFEGFLAAFSRFCSASLTDPGQLRSRKAGYKGQLFFANEENGDNGRLFAVSTKGRAWQLPRVGLFSYENTLAAYNTSDTTLVVGNEDGGAGQIWTYVGSKRKLGSPVAAAGLTNGTTHVIDLLDETVSTDAEFRAAYDVGDEIDFDLAEIDWDQSGTDQNADAADEGLSLNRVEDGSWDPSNPNDYYFTTTDGGEGPNKGGGGGVWRARFDNIERPELGGTLTLLLDGSEVPDDGSEQLYTPDNMTIDQHGHLLLQEDPGGNPHLARIMAYQISDGMLVQLAEFDPARFTAGEPGFITDDEESSAIIDLEDQTGEEGAFMFDAQVHTPPANNAVEYVERGQLLAMHVDWEQIFGDD